VRLCVCARAHIIRMRINDSARMQKRIVGNVFGLIESSITIVLSASSGI
jgi:hypothetical protein